MAFILLGNKKFQIIDSVSVLEDIFETPQKLASGETLLSGREADLKKMVFKSYDTDTLFGCGVWESSDIHMNTVYGKDEAP